MIYDEQRHEVCVHEAGKDWFLADSVTADLKVTERVSDLQKCFEERWKSFYETIGIKAVSYTHLSRPCRRRRTCSGNRF